MVVTRCLMEQGARREEQVQSMRCLLLWGVRSKRSGQRAKQSAGWSRARGAVGFWMANSCARF